MLRRLWIFGGHLSLFQSGGRTSQRPYWRGHNGTPNNLMPYITQVALGKRKQLSVFGADYDTPDGTCIRDYIHIMDIAAGHTAALPFCTSHHGVEVINLGTGMGHSVLELISAFESATGIHIPFQIVGRRAEISRSASPRQKKAKVLLWLASHKIFAGHVP